jgi:hypothetical protein
MGSVGALDTFARVATVADLDILLASRVDASALAHTEFRTNVVVLTFQDIDTAIAAIPVIRDRVNALTTVRNKAIDQFLTNRQIFEIPTPVELNSVKQDLIDAYTGARDARTAADTAQGTAQSEYDDAQAVADKQRDVAQARCEQAESLNKANELAVRASDALASSQGALMAALRAASRLTNTLGTHKLKAAATLVNSDGEFVVSGNENESPPDYFGTADLIQDGIYSEDAASDTVTLKVEGDITPLDYVKVGTLVSVAKKMGGAYVGTIIQDPVVVDAGPNARTQLVCSPIRPGVQAQDFFSEGFKMVQRNMTQEVSKGQEIDPNGQIVDLGTQAQVVTVMEATPTVEFSSVKFMSATDAIGINGDGGLAEQVINPILALIAPLLNPSTGLLGVIGAERAVADNKCQSANLILDANVADEDSALSNLKEKRADTTAAQAREDSALADLKEYCPDLDVTTI